MRDLIAPVRKLHFTSSERERFVNQLAMDNTSKVIKSVEELRDAALSPNGLFNGVYQLTQIGAEQYFNCLARGMYQTVRSLVNEEHPDVNTRELPTLVARLANATLKHRYAALEGRRAVCCESRKQLDGFVSRSYVMISNEQVYGLFKDSCEMMKYKMPMLCGAIDARDMTVVVSARESLKTPDGKALGLYMGAVCQNGETAGRAIRTAPTLLDSKSKSWSVAPFERDLRLSHTKSRKLRDKMMAMGDLLATNQVAVAKNAIMFHAAAKKRVAKDWNAKSRRGLRAGLVGKGDQMHVGSHSVDKIIELLPADDNRPPTLQDVYLATLEVADSMPVGNSIPVRQLAYKLVFDTRVSR